MKTNHELAREAELKVQILLAVEIPNVATSDLMPEVRKIIADTYAEAMKDRDELRDCLEELVDRQDGPPLERHRAKWEAVMKRAEQLLDRSQPLPQPPEATK